MYQNRRILEICKQCTLFRCKKEKMVGMSAGLDQSWGKIHKNFQQVDCCWLIFFSNYVLVHWRHIQKDSWDKLILLDHSNEFYLLGNSHNRFLLEMDSMKNILLSYILNFEDEISFTHRIAAHFFHKWRTYSWSWEHKKYGSYLGHNRFVCLNG